MAMANSRKLLLRKLFTCLSLLVVQLSTVFCDGIENSLPNCAACFSQKWDWDSWQCDVNCNVPYDPYQLVDAFKAQYTDFPASGEQVDVTQFSVFPFNTAPLNLHNGYDTATGKFTVTIAGIYLFSLQARAVNSNLWFNVKVKKSGVEATACWAWTNSDYDMVKCDSREEMEVGDEAYVFGQGGKVNSRADRPLPTFQGHLLFRKK